MEEVKIWELDGRFGVEIVGIGKRLITIRKNGKQKNIRFIRELDKISKSAIVRTLQDAFGG